MTSANCLHLPHALGSSKSPAHPHRRGGRGVRGVTHEGHLRECATVHSSSGCLPGLVTPPRAWPMGARSSGLVCPVETVPHLGWLLCARTGPERLGWAPAQGGNQPVLREPRLPLRGASVGAPRPHWLPACLRLLAGSLFPVLDGHPRKFLFCRLVLCSNTHTKATTLSTGRTARGTGHTHRRTTIPTVLLRTLLPPQ